MLRRLARIGIRAILLACLSVGAFWAGSILSAPREDSPREAGSSLAESLRGLAPGWNLQIAREMPEQVNALVQVPANGASHPGAVFVGTSPIGSIYWFNPCLPRTFPTLAIGLGDRLQFG